MRAIRLHNIHDLRAHDESVPTTDDTFDTLLKVTSVGVCGSDLHWFEEGGIGDAKLKRPLVLGHEFAAVVESGPLKGRRVAVDPAIPCGRCELCLAGHSNLCEKTMFSGHGSIDGALREYMPWPSENLHLLPDSVSDDDGALLEPLGVAIHAVDLGHLKTGMSVGVFGVGAIGLLTQQVARAAGATDIFVTDRRRHRLDASEELGAHHTYLADDAFSESQAILADTNKRGLDVAFECAGDNATVESAFNAVKPGGTVVLVGIPSDDRTSFTASVARRKGLTIKMSRRMKPVYPRAIALVQRGMVNVRALVSARFKLAEAQAAFENAQRREGLKVVIEA
jgi:L-iditol 2-dehydrogenase